MFLQICAWHKKNSGPAAPIIIANSEKEAMTLANNSQYASIWTEDLDKAETCQEWFDLVW